MLDEAYDWVLRDPEFLSWRDSDDTRLLWMKGDAGKGKTMMMIALISVLSQQLQTNSGPGLLSYFFCQATDARLNNAISVLRGLIYMLIVQQNALIQHLWKEYKAAGSRLFEGPYIFFDMRRILLDMLKDPGLGRVYLVVDALDECDYGLPELLDLIADEGFELPSRVKWLVSSRNQPHIQGRLKPKGPRLQVSLELNSSHISLAVNAFIDYKVQDLARRKGYRHKLQEEVALYLKKNAEGTFLWAALACKALEKVSLWKTRSTLNDFPPGLNPLYERMIGQILNQEDQTEAEVCIQIISATTLVHRPLHLKELESVADLPAELGDDIESLKEIVELCGSFLTIQDQRVYFIHQSAKDYLITGKGSNFIPADKAGEHGKIAYRLLSCMSGTLRMDMCALRVPGALLEEISNINMDSIAPIRYACCHWVDHLCQVDLILLKQAYLVDDGEVHKFLQKYLLYWFEALSLMRETSRGVLMIKRLQALVDVSMVYE